MRTRRIAAGFALLGVLAPVSASSAAPKPPACAALAFSPDFGRDRTMFCAVAAGAAYVHRSTDGGRTWGSSRLVSSDAPGKGNLTLTISPLFTADRQVFVSTLDGLFRSTDAGLSFREVAIDGMNDKRPPAWRMIPYTETVSTAPSADPHAAFAIAEGSYGSARVYDTERGFRAVAGAPGFNTRFIIPPDYSTRREAVVLSSQLGVYQEYEPVNEPGLGAYLCVADFVCPHRLFYFGEMDETAFGKLGRPGSEYIAGNDISKRFDPKAKLPFLAFRTKDYGRTWEHWSSVEKLLTQNSLAGASLTVTSSADAPTRLFLHLAGPKDATQTKVPAYQLFRSDDDGKSWRRIGHSWGATQRVKSKSTLPWNSVGDSAPEEQGIISAQPGGRLYALGLHKTGTRVNSQGMYCSLDLGRTWRIGRC